MDLIISATIDDLVLIDADSAVILSAVDAIGAAGVEISRLTNGLPDSGHPSNSLSSSWTVGNVGTLFMMARLTWDVAAGDDHGWAASYPCRPASLYGL